MGAGGRGRRIDHRTDNYSFLIGSEKFGRRLNGGGDKGINNCPIHFQGQKHLTKF
jgi:hypothetical protein